MKRSFTDFTHDVHFSGRRHRSLSHALQSDAEGLEDDEGDQGQGHAVVHGQTRLSHLAAVHPVQVAERELI